jgi:hypothetical protein
MPVRIVRTGEGIVSSTCTASKLHFAPSPHRLNNPFTTTRHYPIVLVNIMGRMGKLLNVIRLV